MRVNKSGMFRKEYQRVNLSDTGKYFIHFTRFCCDMYELMFRVTEDRDTGTPRFIFCHTSFKNGAERGRYTPFIYVLGDAGIFGGDDTRPVRAQIETTSYGSLSVEEIDFFVKEMQRARTIAACIEDDFIKPLLDGGTKGLRDSGLMVDLRDGFKPGDIVKTPRFLNVELANVYTTPLMMRECGYTEPTHFVSDDIEICGQSIGENQMEFAAALR